MSLAFNAAIGNRLGQTAALLPRCCRTCATQRPPKPNDS